MDDVVTITGRKFTLSVRGYDQDEVDGFLRVLATRLNNGADAAAEAARIAGMTRFTVVTLGYTRNEVHQHLNDLRLLLMRRAGAPVVSDVVEAPRAAEELPLPEPVAEVEAVAPEAIAVPEAVADTGPVEAESAGSAEEVGQPAPAEFAPSATYPWMMAPVDELPMVEEPVAEEAVTEEPVAPAAHEAEVEVEAEPVIEQETPEPVTEPEMIAEPEPEPVGMTSSRDDERAALFAVALDMRIDDAVSMTRDELQAAIDRARGGTLVEAHGHGATQEVAAEPDARAGDPVSQEVMAALRRAQNALNAFEALLNGEVAELGGAVRMQRDATQRECLELVESAQRDAERMLETARLRIAEMAASAERGDVAVRARAEAYADRIRRSAEAAALRETVAAAGEAAASLPAAESDPAPEAPTEVATDSIAPSPAGSEAPAAGEAEDRPGVVGLTRDIIKLLQGRPVPDQHRR